MPAAVGSIGVGNIGSALAVTSVAAATSATGSDFEVIVIAQGPNGATAPTITDNKGNSALYTQIGSAFNNGNNGYIWRFIAANRAGGAGHTATATFSANIASGISIILLEMKGCALSSPLDQSNTGTSGPSQTTGPGVSGNITVTPPASGEILVSVMMNDDSSAALTYAEANGFTIQVTNTAFATFFWQWAIGTKIVSSPGTYSASWTWGGANLSSACLIDSFKGAPAGGGADTMPVTRGVTSPVTQTTTGLPV
jgi:hypothetical protein